MEINGIEIKDIKDAQDVLTALETLRLGIEILSDSMNENYTNYNSLTVNINDSVHSQKELIDGLSHLQMKAHALSDNYQALSRFQKETNDNNILMLKKEFKDFDRQIKNTMSNVVNEIDLSIFERQVETLFNDKISILENEARRLKSNVDDFEKLNTTIKLTLGNARDGMNNSINQFNALAKSTNWKVILGVGFTSIFAGALLMMFFGLSIAKSQIFKDEQMVISDYKEKIAKMESKYIAASKFEEVVREYEVTFIHNEEGKYILIPNEKVENAFKTRKNWQAWKLR